MTPRGGRDEVTGVEAGSDDAPTVRVRVAAAPVDGRANEALERLLANALEVPRSRVRVVSGMTSRRKQVEVEGVGVEDLLMRLQRAIT